ncbi:MAG: hypothetical protein IPJ19_07865 [Planctomycetes bacterium]|nr:hypothetical protein [Planctomycetota bacterium]
MRCSLRHRLSIAVLLFPFQGALAQTPDLANTQQSTRGFSKPGKVWSCAGTYWNPIDVSIGNRGTQVFAGVFHNLYNDPHAFLLSSHDADPATPCLEAPDGNETTSHSASASFADVHVTITDEETADINLRIRRVNCFSSRGLEWVYTYPQLGAGRTVIGVSRGGQKIVAGVVNPTTGLNDVLVFGPDSSQPQALFPIPGGVPWDFDLSADGTHALFAIGSKYQVLDLGDGSVHLVYDHSPYSLSEMGCAISGDGSVVGCSTSVGIGLFEWNGSDYVQTWSHSFGFGLSADISDDSSTMAFGTGGGYGSPHTRTECVDIPSKQITMSEDLWSTGDYGNRVEDIAIAADGSRFASASWGDQFGLVPEVRIYSKYQSTPLQTLDLPGSADCIDITPDGQWIAAGSRPVHAELPSIGGRVDLFHMGRSDFRMRTVPAVGSSVTFEVFGVPGRQAWLLDSPDMLDPPQLFPNWGALHLDLATLHLTPIGTIGPSGSRTLDVALPSDPLLIGSSHYYQGFTNDPVRRLTHDWLVVTLLP